MIQKIQELAEQYNIPQEIIDIWCREEGEELLEVQRKAIENFGLFEGKNLLITAPSSSGKTFVGEMAAIHSYYEKKKTIFLVPMKAIAEEKYAEFIKKYRDFGLRIVVSTHDRTEFDDSILAGYFDIAVIIFEKMNALLTQNRALLNSCGLVVVDELQLINDRSRGADLEILITKIKMVKEESPERFQFLGLSAVLANLTQFDEWLNADHLDTRTRPLELHEGVLSVDGSLRVHQFNKGQEYTASLPAISRIHVPVGPPRNRRESELLEESILQKLTSLCKYYLSKNKRILIFRKWRPTTRDTAQHLAQELNLPPASNVIQNLRDMENTNSREALIQCLGSGIAFHNSDLSPEERLTIETDFRNYDGQIKVICSTSTLAMGVNLSSSVVIIPDTVKPDPDAESFHEIPITAAEYKNMAGRAGRTRFKEEGISILLANSTAEATKYWRNYVHGKLDTLSPPLEGNDLRKIILGLFASGLCRNQEEIQTLLLSSYTGYVRWNRSTKLREPFLESVVNNCHYLKDHDLLTAGQDGRFSATQLGTLCAASGVEIDSFVLLKDTLSKLDIGDWDPWEIIFPCLHCRELTDLIRIYIRIAHGSGAWEALERLEPKNREVLCNWSAKKLRGPDDVAKRVQSFLMINDWINGVEMRRIENTYTAPGGNRVLSGTIRNIAENTAWMIQTMGRIAHALDYDIGFIDNLQILSERVARGVKAEGIEIHKLGVRGVTRTTIRKLVEAKYYSLDHILDTPADDFKGIISPRIAQQIHEAIVQKLGESQERAKHVQSYRLEKQGVNPEIIKAIYEKEGVELEDAIVDMLNSPPLELCAERIGRQREGEPDIRLALSWLH